MSYEFNPHRHNKIWISKDPSLFMNFENQVRLIKMRFKNPDDEINLVFDSELLSPEANNDLHSYCKRYRINPIDASGPEFKALKDKEAKLYAYYKEEVKHLKEGGNLGVASDILRCLSPVFTKGTYTDLDVPVETRHLPDKIEVKKPIIFNIGSFSLFGKEMPLTNNDFIAVVDASDETAKKQIDAIQDMLISRLGRYESDYIQQTEKDFGPGFFMRTVMGYLKNREEADFIQRSNDINQEEGLSSRALRAKIIDSFSSNEGFLAFNKVEEGKNAFVANLKAKLSKQLGFIKWLFFNSEYQKIKAMIALDDDKFLTALREKEKQLYIKSIVICSTGPIAFQKALFGKYVDTHHNVKTTMGPCSFNTYPLIRKAFKSTNSLPLHQSTVGMLKFLGKEEGKLNDSSWLENGASLQKSREDFYKTKQTELESKLPSLLETRKRACEQHLTKLEARENGLFSFIGRTNRQAKIAALRALLACYNGEHFSRKDFFKLHQEIDKKRVYAGFFNSHTQYLFESLYNICYDAELLQVDAEHSALTDDPSNEAHALSRLHQSDSKGAAMPDESVAFYTAPLLQEQPRSYGACNSVTNEMRVG